MAVTNRVLRQREDKAAELAKAEADEAYLAGFGLKVGDLVRVEDDRSVFKVFGVGRDGSVTVVDQDQKAFRSFRPDWCFPAFRVNRKGHRVRTGVPPAVKGLRDVWAFEHGLTGRNRIVAEGGSHV